MSKDQGQDACSQGTSASQRLRKNRLLRTQPLASLAASALQQVGIRLWTDPLRRSLTLTPPRERGQSCTMWSNTQQLMHNRERPGVAVRPKIKKRPPRSLLIIICCPVRKISHLHYRHPFCLNLP